jgi:hypothetical protein
MNTVEYKYTPGQKVYVIVQNSIPYLEKCRTCIGEGFLKNIDDKKIPCPECKGARERSYGGSVKMVVKEREVGAITINVNHRNGYEIIYKFSSGEHFTQPRLFDKKKDAEKECERQNSKFIAGYTN